MNASRLREILDLLLSNEEKFEVQKKLDTITAVLGNLVGQPQEAKHQTALSEALIRAASPLFMPSSTAAKDSSRRL
jgi:hypothetical protein